MKKCIILHTANYSSKIKNYFCVDELIKNGVDVEFWNVGPITVNEHLAEEFSKGLIIHTINSIKELKAKIQINKEAYFFSYINFAWYSLLLYRELSKQGVKIVYCTSGCLPSFGHGRIQKSLSIVKLKNITRYLIVSLLRKSFLVKPADFVLKSCKYSDADCKVSKNTIYIGINSSDYQGFKLKIKESSFTVNKERNIVYIDQYLPFHKDYTLFGIKHIDKTKFYKSLNSLFSKLEKIYDCKVVIAAHPSSILYKQENYFEGREIFFNKTSELIHGSIGAISFTSTAVSFPVIEHKPILFYSSFEIDKKYTNQFPRLFSELLGSKFINIDEYSDCRFNNVDTNKYDAYIYDYLTTKSSINDNNSDIILSIINNDYFKFKYYE